jgi:hypothetical protein
MRTDFIFPLIALLFFSDCSTRRTPDLQEVVESVNAKCPQMLDAETRIDGVSLHGTDTLRYNYTLVNLNVERLDTSKFRVAMWPGILAHIRVSSDLKALKDDGTVFQYQYKDKAGRHVYLFTIAPALYR